MIYSHAGKQCNTRSEFKILMGKGKIRQKSPTTAYLLSGASEQLEIIGGKV